MSSTTQSNDSTMTNPNINTHSFNLKPKPQNILIMRIMLLLLTFSVFSANAKSIPVPEKILFQKTSQHFQPSSCTATISEDSDFFVYNCGGTTYQNTYTSTCTKSAATCSEASTLAINCANAALLIAGRAWKRSIIDAHCPGTMIDWID